MTQTQELEKIVLIGATGTIGKPILAEFVAKINRFKRLAVITSQSTYESKGKYIEELKAAGVEIIIGDISKPESLKETFAGFDTVVSALGRAALHVQLDLVDVLATITPSIRFYPSEYGTDIRYDPETSPHEIPHQQKLKVRAKVEALASEGRITFTYIVTGPFADTFFRRGNLAGVLPDGNTYGIIGSSDPNLQAKISGTTYSDTARYVVSSVLTPEASENATLRVSSFTAKPANLQVASEKVLGKKLETQYVSLDEHRATEKQKWEEKDPWATGYTLLRLWYEGRSDFSRKPKALYLVNGKEVEDKEKESQLFRDVPQRPLEEVITEILGA
ncbi:hypothetical protein HK097_010433 [Rhizophlyctis rosea]|uniref:NmrA-like domain-containing protein n=1 Tax=Rhizophlyctis rosea TaxID=64517 RepID=A0AAD5S7N4_9FUNG|nr:hypothetical protein HK097_010433 [Rhizophlyctis rosea]